MEIKQLVTVSEMVAQIDTIRLLYPEMTTEKYATYLNSMVSNGYQQVAIFENDQCVALSGFWYNIKLWTGPYLEIDNFIVHPQYRKKSLGKQITDFIDAKAQELSCTCIVLDAFTSNFTAHRFYYNQGYEPRGFHFIKTIDENGFS
jgi:ribosomal protein S18 acetylase RimI-like enzyme